MIRLPLHGLRDGPRLAFGSLLATYLVLAVAYGLATPILEASDENWHEAVAWQIIAGHGLPVLQPAESNSILVPAQEAGQPPLYYLLAAAATFWTHPPDPAATLVPSPNPEIGHPDSTSWHKNLLMHGASEDFPWHGLALAVHLQRLLSTLMGVGTVGAIYLLGRLAAPGRRVVALLSAALVAFNPMFLFITASVDNDALAICISTVILLLLAYVLRRGATMPRAAGAGVLLGLATLTKLSAAAVALPTAIIFLGPAAVRRSAARLAQFGAALAVPALAIAGWWLVRNWSLYGDPLGLAAFVQVAGPRHQALTPRELWAELPGVWTGFWGVFGIFDILPPSLYASAERVLIAAAGLGLVLLAADPFITRRAPSARKRLGLDAPILALLTGWLILEFLLLVRWTAATEASSGRLMFSALGSVGVLTALGLVGLARRAAEWVAGIITVVMASGSALLIPVSILPAYAIPPFVDAAALKPAVPLDLHFGRLTLVGASFPASPLVPGSTATVTLFWRAAGPTTRNDVVSVQLNGPGGVRVEQSQYRTDAFPGGGKILTTRWPAGQGLVDTIPIRLRADISAPSLVHIRVFVYPVGHPTQEIEARTDLGTVVATPEIGTVVYGTPAHRPAAAPLATFGGRIALDSASLPSRISAGDVLRVRLDWRALAAPGAAYTAFVHVGPPDAPPLAQKDQQPLQGALPTTEWVLGERIDDTIAVPIPASLHGPYDVWVGWYEAPSGTRLPVDNGATEVRIGSLLVTPPGGS